jgi:hypothetical protein
MKGDLKRQATISESKEVYYGIAVEETTREKIIEKMKNDIERSGNKRYFEYFLNE